MNNSFFEKKEIIKKEESNEGTYSFKIGLTFTFQQIKIKLFL